MRKIESFTVDHTTLLPGVYLSRRDRVSPRDAFDPLGAPIAPHDGFDTAALYPVCTYDIRLTRPNFESVMGTGEIHAIEHLGATYLRNRTDLKYRVIYWGPMGCRTGFYLILTGDVPVETVAALMRDTFGFIADYKGAIPGASPVECGNYSDMDLPAAKARASAFLAVLDVRK